MIESLIQLYTTDFVLYALAAGISLALVAGPLGSFIVWRRMSYFGDTLAHSALLGIAVGLLTNSNPQLFFAVLLTLLERRPGVSTDTLLGIIAHSSLAMGVVVLALSDSIRVNLEAYLFGALLTISSSELLWVVAIAAFVSLILYLFWNDLLSATVHVEIAEIEGTNVRRLNLILVLLIALVVSVSMKIVGVLLITSLLIIPPAAARGLAQTPEQMAIKASCIGSLSIVTGLTVAFFLDVPVGPAIVVAASAIFLALYFYPGVHKV